MAKIVIMMLSAVVLVLLGSVVTMTVLRAQSAPATRADRVNTTLLNFDVKWIVREANPQARFAGGLGLHDEGVFVAEGTEGGAIYFLPADADAVIPTGMTLPQNNRSLMPTRTVSGREVDTGLLRYNDLAVLSLAGDELLLASYSHYKPEEGCFVNRLVSTPLPEGWLAEVRNGSSLEAANWRVEFETSPCLPILDVPGYSFTGHQAGGRIAITDDGVLYLTVGDYQFDGIGGRVPPHPQLAGSDYGKIIRLLPAAGAAWHAEVVSAGHRNPQGITLDAEGNIWSVEHGAMGGDELNRIVDGANYGWPVVTLGVNYTELDSDTKFWPFNQWQGHHQGYLEPIYAWVPSIAPSSIKLIENLDPRWDGDLLVGFLKGGRLMRLRMHGDRVEVAENIGLGRRVRYAEVGHGRIYVLFDPGEIAVLVPRRMQEEHVDIATVMNAEAGDEAVAAGGHSVLADFGCLQCHGDANAPRLAGILGSDIAAQAGIEYSEALLQRSGTWSEPNLRAFLTDTQAFAAGSLMPAQRLSSQDIDAVILALGERR